jgi:hypothetical protein
MQNTPGQTIYSTTTILWSLVELQRTVVWKNRDGKRFKERGQGLRRGMVCNVAVQGYVQDLAGEFDGQGG